MKDEIESTRAGDGIPAGFALVPLEPTPTMIEAICADHAPGLWPNDYGEYARGIRRSNARAGYIAMLAAAPAVSASAEELEDIEQYRLQMAGISTAAIGYWKESDGILHDYDTLALRDVAKLYAKYDALFKLRAFVEDELFQIAGFLVGEGDAADLAARRIRAICARIEATRASFPAPVTGDAA